MAGRLLLPLVEPRAYLRAIHFLLMFPLGIAYFVFFVVAFAFGGAMIWTFVGPPVLLLAIFTSLYIGDVEAWLVNLTTREGIKRPPKVVEGAVTLREKVWTRLIDPSTWTGILYEVAQFPIGVAAFVAVIVGFSVAGSFVAAPVILWVDKGAFEVEDGNWILGIDKPLEALALVPVGLLAWFLTMHIITALSAVHAMWARLMLGTRSRRTPGAEQPEAPGPPPYDPVKLLPPGDPPPAGDGPPSAVAEPLPPRESESPPFEGQPESHPALAELTPREREVLLLAVRGYSNADICEALFVSEGTVKTHVRHILAKLDLTDRTQLIVFAYEQGVIRPARRAVAVAIMR